MHNYDLTEEKGYGARVERGRLKGKQGERFTVESFCRPGIVTPPLKAIPACEEEMPVPYAVGDKVYFFVFADGGGAIIGRIEVE